MFLYKSFLFEIYFPLYLLFKKNILSYFLQGMFIRGFNLKMLFLTLKNLGNNMQYKTTPTREFFVNNLYFLFLFLLYVTFFMLATKFKYWVDSLIAFLLILLLFHYNLKTMVQVL